MSDREAAIRELRQRLADWSPDAPEEAQKGYKAAAWDAFVIVEAELAAAREEKAKLREALRALPHQKWCSAAQSAGMVPCNCPRALADGEGET